MSGSFQTFPDISSNINLKNLKIKGDYKTLPNYFSKLIKLETLDLFGGSQTFPDISSNINLKILELAIFDLKLLPESFKKLKNLRNYIFMQNDMLII